MAVTVFWSVLTHTQELVRRPHPQKKSPEAKGSEASSGAKPRLEGVTIAEA